MEKKIIPLLYIAALFLLSLPTILPLFHAGIFTMHDNTQVVRIYQMQKAISDGMFPVRWVQDLGYGYGYPIFNFYAPLAYYIGSLFSFFTGPLLATKIMFGLVLIGSAFSMYLASARFFSRPGALAAAITYLYFPYHAVNIYVRGALSESLAYAFIPLVFYGIFLLHDNLSKKTVKRFWIAPFIIVMAFAATALSHNLSALILCLTLVPIIIIGVLTTHEKKRFFTYTFATLVIGGLLTSFYTAPALLEMSYTNVGGQLGGGAVATDNFVCLKQLWSSPWGYGGSVPGCLDGMSFALGKINIALTALSLVLLSFLYIFKKEKKNIFPVLTAVVLLFLSLFMTQNYSTFLWEMLPGIDYIQYPWRFLNITALSISLLVAGLVFAVSKITNTKIALVAGILIVFVQIYLNYDIFKAQAYDSTKDPTYQSYKYITETASKISDEYLPKNFSKPVTPEDIPQQRIEIAKGNAEINVTRNTTTKFIFMATQDNKTTVVKISKTPYPTWQLTVDGNSEKFTSKNDGIYISLLPGTHEYSLKYISSNTQKTANAVSIVTIIAGIAGIISITKKHEKTS